MANKVDEIFGGLYYEQAGQFFPVHNNPRYTKRVEDLLDEVLEKAKDELILEGITFAGSQMKGQWILLDDLTKIIEEVKEGK